MAKIAARLMQGAFAFSFVCASAVAAKAQAETTQLVTGALCRDTAIAPRLPESLALQWLAEDLTKSILIAAGEPPETTIAYNMAIELPWREALLAAGKDYPPGMEDLPWLLVLWDAQKLSEGEAGSLVFGSLNVVAADYAERLARLGLTDLAGLFKALAEALPPTAKTATARMEALSMLYQTAPGPEEPPLFQALMDYEADYGLRDKIYQMSLGRPELAEKIAARLRASSDEERMAYLVERLEQACGLDEWFKDDQISEKLAQAAPVPLRIWILDVVASHLQEAGISWLMTSDEGRFAPEIVQALRDEGLGDIADHIQVGMDMFPKPWPRDLDARLDTLEADEEIWSRLTMVTLPPDSVQRIRAKTLALVKEADLLPRAD